MSARIPALLQPRGHSISRLLHISHSQWIYRNITLHHNHYGAMALQERTWMLREIDRYMELEPSEVPEESRFLLEINFQQLQGGPSEEQNYYGYMRLELRYARADAKAQSAVYQAPCRAPPPSTPHFAQAPLLPKRAPHHPHLLPSPLSCSTRAHTPRGSHEEAAEVSSWDWPD